MKKDIKTQHDLKDWNRFIIEELEKRETYLSKIFVEMKNNIDKSPDGKLRVQKKENCHQYYLRTSPDDTNGVYIPKTNIELAKGLAQKDYDYKVVELIKKEMKKIASYKKFMETNNLAEIYESFHPSRQRLISPLVIPDIEFIQEWKQQNYTKKGFEDEAEEFYSNEGVRVRSKSEAIIASMLEHYKIPYKYETPIVLEGYGPARPDFLCLNIRLRTEYYWEHYGMMDNIGYANKNVKKIHAYEQNGFYSGENMIMTFESSRHPLSTSTVKNNIARYLL